VKVLDLEAVVDAAVDDLEEVGAVVEPPIAISESSGAVLEAAVLVEDTAEPLPLHTVVDSAALLQLLLTAELLLMAGPVAMAAEAMATRPVAEDNLGGRLPVVDASLFLFRYIFDSGTIHRSGTKASTDIFRLSLRIQNSFSSALAVFVLCSPTCTAFFRFPRFCNTFSIFWWRHMT
jgi:hypothetical protein